MLERYDSSELLDLIEGDLDQRSASALQARLAKDPQALAMVQSMARDRAELRSLDEPALPQDFIATIEPMLTRPMLIEHATEIAALKPGEFRRRHRQQTRRSQWRRLTAAAAILLLLFGGTWTLISNWNALSGNNSDDLLTASSTGGPSNAGSLVSGPPQRMTGSSTDDSIATLGPGTVHHDRPPRHGIASDTALAAADPRDLQPAATNTPAAGAEPIVLAADFAVVVRAKNPNTAESTVAGALADLGSRVAFVKNFSYAEAQQLSEENRLAHARSGRNDDAAAGDPAMASIAPGSVGATNAALSPGDMHVLAERVRDQWQIRAAAANPTPASASPTVDNNAVVSGAASLSPTLEQQLEFSVRGASYTIAVPASELVSLIERMTLNAQGGGAMTSLRMLPTRGSTDAASPSQGATTSPSVIIEWLAEGPQVRQAMQRLTQARGDAIVLLPVVVQ